MVFNRVNKAYKRQKELTAVLDKYRLELERIRGLAESVRNEKALEEANVSGSLTRLKELEDKLCSWLAKVDPGDKNSLRRFADQLVRGQSDRKKLDDIMRDLDRVKCDLNLVIDMHQVRMSYNISQTVVTNSNGTVSVHQKGRSTAGRANVTVPTQARTNGKDIDRIPKA